VADVKWVKLTTDMFDNRKIRHLRRLPDGNNIVLIWVMLLTMAGRCNANGMIFLTENIPYTPKMLADELGFEENTVILALNALENLDMIVTDCGFFAIAGWSEYQNIDGMDRIKEQNRLRKQAQRERERAALCDGHVTVTGRHATDIDIDKDKEKEKDKESKSVRETSHTTLARLLPEYGLSDKAAGKVSEWITYKSERREAYKEQGMRSLLSQISRKAATYGEQAVCDLIDECMANGWKGIIFDRLQQRQPERRNGNGTDRKAPEGVQYGIVL
jgi:predicted phage replisome organizer